MNTMLSAASAGLTAAVITKVRFGKPDASLSANGWIGGLVPVAPPVLLLFLPKRLSSVPLLAR